MYTLIVSGTCSDVFITCSDVFIIVSSLKLPLFSPHGALGLIEE